MTHGWLTSDCKATLSQRALLRGAGHASCPRQSTVGRAGILIQVQDKLPT